jgi:dTDP-4-amino-4,6-dideoxygalactose transaminase
MSYVATANSIKYVGAKPVFAEIDPANYNLDVKDAA